MSLSEHFDLILVDTTLPTNDDLSALQSIRIWRQTPAIVISPFNSTEKRIESFQQGADDHLSKPIDLTELVLRINAILRRTINGEDKTEGEIGVDQLTLFKSKQQVFYKGDNLALTPIQFRLLWILVENRFKIVSKQFLYRTVLNRNFSPYDRSLEMHLSRIRKKIGRRRYVRGSICNYSRQGLPLFLECIYCDRYTLPYLYLQYRNKCKSSFFLL